MKREKIKSNRHQNLKQQIRAFCPYPNHFCNGQPIPDKDGKTEAPREPLSSIRTCLITSGRLRKGQRNNSEGCTQRYRGPLNSRETRHISRGSGMT